MSDWEKVRDMIVGMTAIIFIIYLLGVLAKI